MCRSLRPAWFMTISSRALLGDTEISIGRASPKFWRKTPGSRPAQLVQHRKHCPEGLVWSEAHHQRFNLLALLPCLIFYRAACCLATGGLPGCNGPEPTLVLWIADAISSRSC